MDQFLAERPDVTISEGNEHTGYFNKKYIPYAEANMKAAQKTNPMNAKSQETPVGDRVDEFLNRISK